MKFSGFSVRKTRGGSCALLLGLWIALGSHALAQTAAAYQGSVTRGEVSSVPLALTLDSAMERGLQNNLGAILSSAQAQAAGGQRLSRLQDLLPSVEASLSESVAQVDLPAQGLRMQGLPTTIGPFGYTDVRAALNWTLLDVASLRRYLAARHDWKAAQLTAVDARELVVVAVGGAYLLTLADESLLASAEAELATARLAREQAEARHKAGAAPMIDELRARVDEQALEQQRIAAQNSLAKDKLALARAIGLPLAQSFTLADKTPYEAIADLPQAEAIEQARARRSDLAAAAERLKSAEQLRRAATAGRLPTVKFAGDYGDIGVTLSHSHGSGSAQGVLSVPLYQEASLRGQAETAQAALEKAQAEYSDKNAQVEADVRDALLDQATALKLVEVSRSSVALSEEALSQAQQRYVAGVSDNLPVSQAVQALAQANSRQVAALYRLNLARLSLARAMGVAQNYKSVLGGK